MLGVGDEMTVAITRVEGQTRHAGARCEEGEKGVESTFFLRHDFKMTKGKFNKDTKKFEATCSRLTASWKTSWPPRESCLCIIFDANKGISEARIIPNKKKV